MIWYNSITCAFRKRGYEDECRFTPPPPVLGKPGRRELSPSGSHHSISSRERSAIDPRDRGLVDPRDIDPRERGMDPRERGMDPRDRVMDPRERGLDVRDRIDPRERGMDPRERGMDGRERVMDPRDRGMDPRERGMDPRERVIMEGREEGYGREWQDDFRQRGRGERRVSQYPFISIYNIDIFRRKRTVNLFFLLVA